MEEPRGVAPASGLYERLIDVDLSAALDVASQTGHQILRSGLDAAEAPEALASHLMNLVKSALEDVAPSERIGLANSLIAHLGHLLPIAAPSAVVETDPLLLAIGNASSGLASPFPARPEIPLSQSDILMNARGEPSMLTSLLSEMESADHIRVIVSFIKWSGLRHLLPALKNAIHRGVRVQVLTTTYLGASDERAITALADAGAEVRVSYDNRSSRLHAKSWLFDRKSGTHTGYVGSSNMSHQAFSEGQEWNVRLSQHETPHLLTKFRTAFDTYWVEPSFGFESYDPRNAPGDKQRLLEALQTERQTNPTEFDLLLPFEIRPYPYQQEILDALERDRELYQRTRNLIVAATGTGKTVIAALDYARLWRAGKWSKDGRSFPRLLFIAHRKEILEQSRRVFRQVLRDLDFGELLVAGQTPTHGSHVFASVQSLTASHRLENVAADAYDIVIVDEFHHATAQSWNTILQHLKPKILLGLTATPERADGGDVTMWFDHHVSAELRLWDALERDLLIPFHYFAVGSEDLDFRSARWVNGRYSADDVQNVYTSNDAIMKWVIAQVRDKVTAPNQMRALVFTTGVLHADKVAADLNVAGIRAAVITGATSKDDRRDRVRQLRSGELQAIVTVDVFNEGIDIPEVDTVVMLRPTESLTVFLQQLGRGLRKADGKSVLTVLDFVGQHRKEFRFASRLSALTGVPRGGIERAIKDGFPYLPAGVIVRLDEVATSLVIRNIKDSLPTTKKALVQDIISHANGRRGYRLADYLSEAELELADIYSASDRSWSALRRDAGLVDESLALNLNLLKRVRAFAYVDDVSRIHAYRQLLTDSALATHIDSQEVIQRRWAYMLYHNVFSSIEHDSLSAGLHAIQQDAAFRDEVLELLEYSEAHLPHATYPEWLDHPGIPLAVHARYSRAEILAAVGEGDWKKSPNINREGALHAKLIDADVFRMTWQKSEKRYSPNTMYRDFAISRTEVHWQSQHFDRQQSAKIQRYIHHQETGHRILLFAREADKCDLGTTPFMYLGEAEYVSHEGERPVSFIWHLKRAMPADFARRSMLAAS